MSVEGASLVPFLFVAGAAMLAICVAAAVSLALVPAADAGAGEGIVMAACAMAVASATGSEFVAIGDWSTAALAGLPVTGLSLPVVLTAAGAGGGNTSVAPVSSSFAAGIAADV